MGGNREWLVPGVGQSVTTVLRQRGIGCLLFPVMRHPGCNELGRLISQCQFMLISWRSRETDSSATWLAPGCAGPGWGGTCVCGCTHLGARACTSGCTPGCVHTDIRLCVHMCVCTRIATRALVYACTHAHINMHTHAHMHPRTHTHAHMHVQLRKAELTPTPRLGELPLGRPRAGEVGDEGTGQPRPRGRTGRHGPLSRGGQRGLGRGQRQDERCKASCG